MKNILQLGTCRVRMLNTEQFLFTKFFSYNHTAAEMIQTLRILRGDSSIPNGEVVNYMYAYRVAKEWYEADKNRFYLRKMAQDFHSYDGFIVEISSLKNVIMDGWAVNWSHQKATSPDIVQKLKSLPTFEDNQGDLRDKLKEIVSLCGGKPVIFQGHQNYQQIDQRGLILETLTQSGYPFVDPTEFVSLYGHQETLTDPNHFTEFMYEKMRERTVFLLSALFPNP